MLKKYYVQLRNLADNIRNTCEVHLYMLEQKCIYCIKLLINVLCFTNKTSFYKKFRCMNTFCSHYSTYKVLYVVILISTLYEDIILTSKCRQIIFSLRARYLVYLNSGVIEIFLTFNKMYDYLLFISYILLNIKKTLYQKIFIDCWTETVLLTVSIWENLSMERSFPKHFKASIKAEDSYFECLLFFSI